MDKDLLEALKEIINDSATKIFNLLKSDNKDIKEQPIDDIINIFSELLTKEEFHTKIKDHISDEKLIQLIKDPEIICQYISNKIKNNKILTNEEEEIFKEYIVKKFKPDEIFNIDELSEIVTDTYSITELYQESEIKEEISNMHLSIDEIFTEDEIIEYAKSNISLDVICTEDEIKDYILSDYEDVMSDIIKNSNKSSILDLMEIQEILKYLDDKEALAEFFIEMNSQKLIDVISDFPILRKKIKETVSEIIDTDDLYEILSNSEFTRNMNAADKIKIIRTLLE